ncbi:putative WRKY transcription factor 70 [Apostasia shenzhenica]|uniref:Putative WRKY transcription factor 70 n=1 Tax=Apostasia shenzhenica TaxID=1088818 RepID=A0A2I0A6G3_9ASPA|nr:putative WRKY transcription factor 70 [Apostasia shenzhenica]
MGSPVAEGSSAAEGCSGTAMKELARGHESAARLASLLLLDRGRPPPAMAGILIDEIIGTIARAMALLESSKANQGEESPFAGATSTGLGRKGKKRQSTRKAGYRRRSYFRCTHKYDKGCMAARQVQKSESDPSLFVITYFGDHTCEFAAAAPCRSEQQLPAKIAAGFNESKAAGCEIKQEILCSSLPSDLKQDQNEEDDLSNLTSVDSLSDYFALQEVQMKEPSSVATSEVGIDNGDIFSDYDNEYFMDFENLVCFDPN